MDRFAKHVKSGKYRKSLEEGTVLLSSSVPFNLLSSQAAFQTSLDSQSPYLNSNKHSPGRKTSSQLRGTESGGGTIVEENSKNDSLDSDMSALNFSTRE